ncbi:MAG: ABC-type sugar transport system periplasmic component-like protein [Pseudonocardiales bacterium]|nr:ABC-type sugar transport system periplasmic component-like protein [Pseudonocardiales bacterium]
MLGTLINALPRRRRHWTAALVAGTACVALAACSSSATSASSDGSAGASGADGSSASTNSGIAGAQALLDQYSKTPAFVSPGASFPVSSAAGKTIWVVVSDDSIPFLQSVINGMKKAAATVDVNIHVFDGKGQTSTAADGVEQAIAAKAAAIDVISVNLPFISQAVADAKSAGIPVVGVLNTDAKAPVEDGAAGEVTLDYGLQGKLLAAYAIATTKGNTQAAFLNFPSIATFAAMKTGIQDGFTSYCPASCKLNTINLTESDFKTDAQTDTPAALTRNPKTNWIFPAIDAVAQFVIPAINTLGKSSSVQVGSINAFAANLKFVQTNAGQSVDVGNNNAWLGYATLDGSLRAMAGKSFGVETVPVKVFDADNLKGLDVTDEGALFAGTDYATQYAALWQK